MKKRISVVIPHMPSVPGAAEVLDECLLSLRGLHDELIVVVNEGMGYAKAVNQGLKIASGDYIVIANNDTVLTRGDLQTLADWEAVTVPSIFPVPRDELPRCFFCIPNWVYTVTKGFDERFEGGYFEDDDFIRRLQQEGIAIKTRPQVEIWHRDGGGMTMKHIGEQENFDRNKAVFEEIWRLDYD